MKSLLTLLWLTLSFCAFSATGEVKTLRYVPRVRDISVPEKTLNFGIVYTTQWVYYLTLQREAIKDHGSFKNWHRNMLSPHFDKDSFDWNIFKHGLTGHYYYLFYRSRGYDRTEAFTWSILSSLAFEFTIETATERPSYQDIYQTPVYGTVLGLGVEKLSLYFHEKDNWWGHTLGYVLNPFTLLPQWNEDDETISLTPLIDQKTTGVVVTYVF